MNLKKLYHEILQREQKSANYQQLFKPTKKLRNHIIKQELYTLSEKQCKAIKNHKVTFEYRSIATQKEKDIQYNKILRQLDPHTVPLQNHNVYEYTLAKGYHVPLGLKKIKKNGKIGGTYKHWDYSHIKTMIHHHNPECPCHNNSYHGNFLKAKTNFTKGDAGKELCPYEKHNRRWYGESLMLRDCLQYGIYSGASYHLVGTSKYKNKQLHVDRLIPKQQTNIGKPIAIEYDGEQHDMPTFMYTKTKNKKHKRTHTHIPQKQISKQQRKKYQNSFRKQVIRDNTKNKYLEQLGIPLIRIKISDIKDQGISATQHQQSIITDRIVDKAIYPMLKHTQLATNDLLKAQSYLTNGRAKINSTYKQTKLKEPQINEIMQKHNRQWKQLQKHINKPKQQKRAKRNIKRRRHKVAQALKGYKLTSTGKILRDKDAKGIPLMKLYKENEIFYRNSKKLGHSTLRNQIFEIVGKEHKRSTHHIYKIHHQYRHIMSKHSLKHLIEMNKKKHKQLEKFREIYGRKGKGIQL